MNKQTFNNRPKNGRNVMPGSPSCSRPGRVLRGGFTLIELLTVIAILGILAAILIPVTAQVRAAARQSQCASNMRQIGVALRMYVDDNNGRVPETAHEDRTRSWIFSLHSYLGSVDEIRICPADPLGDEKRQREGTTSYIVNDIIFAPAQNEFGQTVGDDYRQIDLLDNPSQTMVAFIGADNMGLDPKADHTHAINWANNWSAVIDDIAPDRHRVGPRSPDRTSGSANYLFADGHVESIAASTIRQRIEAGENIALPPEAQ